MISTDTTLVADQGTRSDLDVGGCSCIIPAASSLISCDIPNWKLDCCCDFCTALVVDALAHSLLDEIKQSSFPVPEESIEVILAQRGNVYAVRCDVVFKCLGSDTSLNRFEIFARSRAAYPSIRPIRYRCLIDNAVPLPLLVALALAVFLRKNVVVGMNFVKLILSPPMKSLSPAARMSAIIPL